MRLDKRYRWNYCELCGEQLAHVGIVFLLTTRGQRPRVQTSSHTFNVCRGCLLKLPARLAECAVLGEAVERFDAEAPKPKRRRSPEEILALCPEMTEGEDTGAGR
jgi:hypothetical protein